jgi:hypothetical protein
MWMQGYLKPVEDVSSSTIRETRPHASDLAVQHPQYRLLHHLLPPFRMMMPMMMPGYRRVRKATAFAVCLERLLLPAILMVLILAFERDSCSENQKTARSLRCRKEMGATSSYSEVWKCHPMSDGAAAAVTG